MSHESMPKQVHVKRRNAENNISLEAANTQHPVHSSKNAYNKKMLKLTIYLANKNFSLQKDQC